MIDMLKMFSWEAMGYITLFHCHFGGETLLDKIILAWQEILQNLMWHLSVFQFDKFNWFAILLLHISSLELHELVYI